MILINNSKDSSQKLLIAETNNDMDVLHFLFDSHIVFGMWKIYDYGGDKSRICREAKYLMTNHPLAKGMSFINKVENYVPKEK